MDRCNFCGKEKNNKKTKYCTPACKRKKELELRRIKYRVNADYRNSELQRIREEYNNLSEENKKKENKKNRHGKKQIESEEENYGFCGIAKIELKKIQTPNEEKEKETPLVDLSNMHESIKTGILQSESYLKNATEQMLSFLNGLHDRYKETENNHINTHAINTAVGCVNQIQKLMRVRLDTAKMIFQYSNKKIEN